jgi:acetoacetate decarboxylase
MHEPLPARLAATAYERPGSATADTEHTIREAWEDPGSISFPDHSVLDSVDRFLVRGIIKAVYMEYDILLPAGRVIARLYGDGRIIE